MRLLLSIFFLSISVSSFAQKDLYNASQKKKLDALSDEITKQHTENYNKALKMATQKGWQLQGDLGNGRTFRLQGIDDSGHPLYLTTESNANAAATTRTNQLYTGGSLGLSLSGSSDAVKNKLGVWDGGAVLGTHQEFGTRVTQQDNVSATDVHATHVSGTMIAAGISAQAKGMSFGANLKAWDFNNDVTEMTTAAKDLAISNHSYGFQAGWIYNSTINRWAWYGSPSVSPTEDYKFGYYDTNTQSWDKIANAAPFYLIVKSAGNNRDSNGPTEGAYYFLGSSTRDSSNVIRSKNDGYDIISTTGTAKNILTVGAAYGTGGVAPLQASDIKISTFSSWGPTDDGRIKPDIVAVGVNLFSTSNASTTAYTIFSGTSMSSPQASGSLLLLQEAYSKQNDGQLMRSSTLKGLVLHTAQDAGNVGPDYIYGWGLLNMEKAASVILNTDKTNSLTERTLQSGTPFTQTIIASGKGALTATICWTDPEGTVLSATTANLNSRTPKLVNDLDIKISDGTNTFLPFILDPEKPADVATRGDNIRDNVEQILIPDAVPGKTYTITISNKGSLKSTTQDYALIISGIGGKDYCASTATTTQDNIESVKLSGASSAFKVSSGQALALDITMKNNVAKTTNVYIDWNLDGTFDETTEKVATSLDFLGLNFTSNFKAPTGLLAGNNTLMRVVSVENVGDVVKSCGTYSRGITKDYPIQFVRPDVDLSVSDLVNPDVTSFCTNSARTVTVALKNMGNAVQQNIPVSVKISDKTGVVATLTGTYKGALTSFAEDVLQLDGTFNALSGTTYTFEISINFTNDQDQTNNVKTVVRQVVATSAPTSALAVVCEGATTLNVKSSETSPVLWYDALTGGNLIFTGNTGSFTKPTNATNVFAGLNDFSGSIGYKDKYALGGGTYYENFGPEPVITTQTPLVIESARVYIGTPGTITFTISRVSDLTPISSVTLKVDATRTTANQTRTNSQLIDDATDQGVVLPLNLSIPAAGTYKLTQECTDGASIYRSNLNAGTTTGGAEIKGYPFTIPNVMSITGALYSSNGVTSLIKTGYYYTYDMKVKSLGCPSVRAEVAITTQAAPKVSVTPSDKLSICKDLTKDLTASSGTNYTYQWLKDGVAVSGETSATIKVGTAGSFAVKVTENGLCSITSTPVVASIITPITPVLSWNGSTLNISSGSNPTWYVGGIVIAGATQNSVVPTKSGVYTVKASDVNGCEAFSNEYLLTITAVEEEIVSEETAKIFPNPATEKIRVEYRSPERSQTIQAEIVNMFGMTLTSKNLVRENGVYTTDFDVTKQMQGRYFVRVVTENSVKTVPFMVGGN
ncbi:putative secreted protein (Por secretion system target) [Arcicella aurantiaca]|uniref:Putative secreted protein (Por secretion system target) n=1 Tax=Arcicella aurantiaca TaxID=591202 RepID=A0A316DGE8_9BACT|nr:S8 family serine peptidase [Arcicella aurantiaca]PWK16726.1 putative secreted protein (Por secretion system target) [Arcicella aurantiaca]